MIVETRTLGKIELAEGSDDDTFKFDGECILTPTGGRPLKFFLMVNDPGRPFRDYMERLAQDFDGIYNRVCQRIKAYADTPEGEEYYDEWLEFLEEGDNLKAFLPEYDGKTPLKTFMMANMSARGGIISQLKDDYFKTNFDFVIGANDVFTENLLTAELDENFNVIDIIDEG